SCQGLLVMIQEPQELASNGEGFVLTGANSNSLVRQVEGRFEAGGPGQDLRGVAIGDRGLLRATRGLESFRQNATSDAIRRCPLESLIQLHYRFVVGALVFERPAQVPVKFRRNGAFGDRLTELGNGFLVAVADDPEPDTIKTPRVRRELGRADMLIE